MFWKYPEMYQAPWLKMILLHHFFELWYPPRFYFQIVVSPSLIIPSRNVMRLHRKKLVYRGAYSILRWWCHHWYSLSEHCDVTTTVKPNLVPRVLSLPTSRKYPGCGWSCVYVHKSNPHRGWVFDLIVSKLSMEVKVALPYRRYFDSKEVICQRSCLTGASFLSELLWVWDVDWKGSLLIFTTF